MHKALIHNQGDHVAVAVAAIAPGEEVIVVFLDDDSTASVVARAAVPYGHKIAVKPCTLDASVLEYGVRIGVATTEIELGDYVHTHNLTTARW